ncbi:AAA family ATPase [Veillonella sp.]|uniref:McrB family protein n=1 Tax=Veillonella sp. TaxID=1926307 RepID=UPI00257D6FD8|nr:AAA family ATPase [Veillonella sp.]MBS6227955.1 AAA family ATPase [Veillonella sp.]
MNNAVKQEKFVLTITADNAVSTDERFDINNLSLGDNYKTLDVKFEKLNGDIITRKYNKGERKNSNQTMPRLALQIFEQQIINLSEEEKETFPICRYTPDSDLRYGIYRSVEDFKKYRNTIEYLKYFYDDDKLLVIYCWNLFSTLNFVQECLKRFGEPGDKFILTYREKDIKESEDEASEATIQEELVKPVKEYGNEYSRMLIESKNIIFRGAPGTGKSYLAKQIATDIISEGYFDKYESLNDEQKKQVEFVQFHPSYDYSDFVEGLRPKINDDGSMGFELKDGIFKSFVSRARRNYENSQKPKEIVAKETSVQESMKNFFDNIELGVDEFKTLTGNSFYVSSIDDNFIHITIPGNDVVNKLVLSVSEIKQMLESGLTFNKVKDITNFFNKQFASQAYSYEFVILKAIQSSKIRTRQSSVETEPLKKYIFIIDEINRGEISKIFGELFYSIDPGYRGKSGEIATQYSNLQMGNEKFYIPENLYIIGTMNDIDRSVDSFDFAMRRRFRFIEIKADATSGMLDGLKSNRLDDAANELLPEEAINRMTALNEAILEVEDLNENYQIGASYFLKLKNLTFDELWTDCLRPLLQEYVQGLYDEEGKIKKFATAYGYVEP